MAPGSASATIDKPTPSVRDYFLTLSSLLSVEREWCQRLDTLLNQKQHAIISGAVKELTLLSAEETQLARQISNQVRERSKVMRQIGGCYGLEMELPRLTTLVALAPQDLQKKLKLQAEDNRALALKIRDNNKQNEFLLKASVEFAQGMIDLLYQHQVKGITMYDPRGIAGKNSADNRLLDRKI